MTLALEEKHSGVMGGRKDDVSKTPKQNRKRPLSAVLEEFEVEDSELKELFNTNNAEDSHSGGVANHRTPIPTANSRLNDTGQNDSTERNPANSSPSSVSVSSLKAFFEAGNVRPLENTTRQTSPKIHRKLTPKFGRRSPRSPTTLSPKIPRRGGSGVFGSSSDRDSDDDMPPTSDMTRLRQMADRLCLSTRRPSVQQWRAQYVESPQLPVWLQDYGKSDVSGQNGAEDAGRWTEERTERINSALDWIKNELQEMRTQDQQLARQLLSIRSDLHQLKLARSCEEHQDMLDDVQSELEDLQEFADVLDLPTPTLTDSPLKHLGVTRMNFSARRFSTC